MPSLNLSYRNDALQVQRRLIELGFLKGFFSDGNWGPTSQQALVEFKKQAGLGSGCHGFQFVPRTALDAPDSIEIRRSINGLLLFASAPAYLRLASAS